MTEHTRIDWQQLRQRLALAASVVNERDVDAQTRDRILRARARSAAREAVAHEAAEHIEVIEFLMSYERYAVEIGWVREVLALRELTPLPGTPRFVAGIVNVRGRILSVVDLKAFFELPDKGLPDLNRVLVISDGRIEFGLLVDAVSGLRRLPVAQLQPALPTMSGVREKYLRGLTADRLAVLDPAAITGDPAIIVRDVRSQ